MLKKSLGLLIFLLIPLLGICQGDYPRKVVIGKDTVVAISLIQLGTINGTFVDADKYLDLYTKSQVAYSYLKISSDVCDAAYKLEQARADSNMISYNKEATANAKLVKSNEALTEKVNRKNKTITYLIIAVVAIPPLLYYIDKANGD
jgi:hypothetical protein